jgi:hypothetical protein
MSKDALGALEDTIQDKARQNNIQIYAEATQKGNSKNFAQQPLN